MATGEWSWETRRAGELTSVYLGRILDEYLELPRLARWAREGRYDDYFCPAEYDDGLNLIHLVAHLTQAAVQQGGKREKISEVILSVKAGEFDGTLEESRRWAESKQGQETIREVIDSGRRPPQRSDDA